MRLSTGNGSLDKVPEGALGLGIIAPVESAQPFDEEPPAGKGGLQADLLQFPEGLWILFRTDARQGPVNGRKLAVQPGIRFPGVRAVRKSQDKGVRAGVRRLDLVLRDAAMAPAGAGRI
jgi:hypothetical protein